MVMILGRGNNPEFDKDGICA
jgi:hypothetical protein